MFYINVVYGNVKELEEVIKKFLYILNIYDICDERNVMLLYYVVENGKIDVCEIFINGIGRD